MSKINFNIDISHLNDYLNQKKGPMFWLIFAGLIMVFTAYIGSIMANITTPPVSPAEPFKHEFTYFDVLYEVQNYNNKKYDLMRATEILQFNFTILNKYNGNTTLTITEKVMNSGKETDVDQLKTPILLPNKNYNVTRSIPLEKSGVNQVLFIITMREDKGEFFGGIQENKNPILDEKTIGYDKRVYTQSEYDYKLERAFIYQWLFLAGAPFILLAVKAMRDIWKND